MNHDYIKEVIYYELWLATGEWLGGGEHPENGVPKTDNDTKIQ